MNIENYYIDPDFLLSNNKKNTDLHSFVKETDINILRFLAFNKHLVPKFLPGVSPDAFDSLCAYASNFNLYKLYGKKTFILQKDFFKKLIESEVKVSIFESLPVNWSAYFAFPDGFMGREWGAYVSIQSPENSINADNVNLRYKYPTLSFVAISRSGEVTYLNLELTPNCSIENIKLLNEGPTSETELKELTKVIILCCLYVNSANPDLRHLKPMNCLTPSAKIGLKNKGVDLEENYVDELNIPVNLVSWNWLKDPLYKLYQWSVAAHFRSVPFGPGRKERKLMWLPPTTATRKAGEVIPISKECCVNNTCHLNKTNEFCARILKKLAS